MLKPGRLRVFWAWTALSTTSHLLWEIVQLPLYTISLDADRMYIAFAVVHCTAGDALISIGTYLGAALAARDLKWPVTANRRGIAVALLLGVFYTAASEWYNVYRVGNWAYLPQMPLILGIGITPLLQWLIVPVATLILMQRSGLAMRS